MFSEIECPHCKEVIPVVIKYDLSDKKFNQFTGKIYFGASVELTNMHNCFGFPTSDYISSIANK